MFAVGDFILHKSLQYVSFIVGIYNECPYGLILTAENGSWATDFVKEGILRLEVSSELEKVEPDCCLISKARNYLDKMNTDGVMLIDNLTYIELLSNLNQKEKDLQNENKL